MSEEQVGGQIYKNIKGIVTDYREGLNSIATDIRLKEDDKLKPNDNPMQRKAKIDKIKNEIKKKTSSGNYGQKFNKMAKTLKMDKWNDSDPDDKKLEALQAEITRLSQIN